MKHDPAQPGTTDFSRWKTFWERLPLWFSDWEERRTWGGGFRTPFSRYMSVRLAKEAGIYSEPR